MIRTLLPASLALLLAATTASAQDHPTYGPRLEGYDYSFPVQTYAFTSQRQPLEMTYMDVAPTGPANGRTAVLLHGKNFCAATWAPTIRVLAEAGFRVITVDQIGFCKASKPAAYQFSLPQLATNTKGLLDSLNIDRAVIVGHSMGGMLAARFAIQHADAVEHLVLVNPIGLEDWQAEGVPTPRWTPPTQTSAAPPSTASRPISRRSITTASGDPNTTNPSPCWRACTPDRAATPSPGTKPLPRT